MIFSPRGLDQMEPMANLDTTLPERVWTEPPNVLRRAGRTNDEDSNLFLTIDNT